MASICLARRALAAAATSSDRTRLDSRAAPREPLESAPLPPRPERSPPDALEAEWSRGRGPGREERRKSQVPGPLVRQLALAAHFATGRPAVRPSREFPNWLGVAETEAEGRLRRALRRVRR